jgi:hypothetical protein
MTDYLIWSHEHDAWWRPARRDYTDDVAFAGRYAEAEARSILAKSSYGWRKGQLPKEVIVPADSPDLDMAVVDETERMVVEREAAGGAR